MATNYSPKIVTDGLVLCLDAANTKSYPGSGTTWSDLSGNGNNGTLVNGVNYSATDRGLLFDGSNNYVTMEIQNPYAETIIVWAKSNSATWNDYGWISSSRRQNGHIIHPNIGDKSVFIYILSQSAGYSLVGQYTVDDITIPHQYCVTTNGSNQHVGYLDSEEMFVSNSAITRTQSLLNTTYTVGRDDTSDRYGNGFIYSVYRYNRALTAAEISQNFQALRGRYGV